MSIRSRTVDTEQLFGTGPGKSINPIDGKKLFVLMKLNQYMSYGDGPCLATRSINRCVMDMGYLPEDLDNLTLG